MSTKVKANFVFAGVEDDIILIGFADDEFDTKEHILLQKSLVYDEQDRELGHYKVHITYIDEIYSAYGGIQKVILKSNSVEIQVDADTAKELKTEERIEVFLSNDCDIDNLKYHFNLMFKDECNIFLSEI
ncbi:Imm10 family immunity protein [Acetivibrio cellulolyticus]|uniref:Imm10 family immunity protein n=1 Tax=Acetivibrio cellulolyticus TaxID=35830 RepID=UPI0001E2D54F|nr:Imm10 family immunity protein [Acetivibrio cellulolyticus]